MQPRLDRVRSRRLQPGHGLRDVAAMASLAAILVVALVTAAILTQRPASAPAAGATGLAVESVADDLRLTIAAASRTVESGEPLELSISVHNAGRDAVGLASWECGAPLSVEASLAAPSDPGRELTDRIELDLRAFALTDKADAKPGPGVVMRSAECALPGEQQVIGDQRLAAGDDLRRTLPWRAELVDGVGASPGVATLTVRVAYRAIDDDKAPYKALVGSTEIIITDGGKTAISAAQALDAVLADEKFSKWLRDAPSESWTAANVFLQNLGPGENGIVPDGPSWEVDLFREVDGARQWAISFVDPSTGAVRSVNVCDEKCGTGEP